MMVPPLKLATIGVKKLGGARPRPSVLFDICCSLHPDGDNLKGFDGESEAMG